MNLLLDTHIFIWFIEGDKQLSASMRKLIENPKNKSYISIGSIWEIAIKVHLGKLQLKVPFIKVLKLKFLRTVLKYYPYHLNIQPC